jgi:hypothetical protein
VGESGREITQELVIEGGERGGKRGKKIVKDKRVETGQSQFVRIWGNELGVDNCVARGVHFHLFFKGDY